LLDTTLVFTGLVGDVIRPWFGYNGVVNTLGIAALAMAAMAGGLGYRRAQ
jgi:hypothetical protein